MSVKIDLRGLPELEALLEQFQGPALGKRTRTALRAGAVVFRSAIRERAPWKRLRKVRISTRGGRSPYAKIEPTWYGAHWAEGGTRPHQIDGLLAFQNNGESIVSQGVNHPGINARPFVQPAFSSYQDDALHAARTKLFEGL